LYAPINDAVRIVFYSAHFIGRTENEPKETAPARCFLRVAKPEDDASPHAAMLRCNARSAAHNHTIAAHLTSRCALPDSMVLAFTIGSSSRHVSELASLGQADTLFPPRPPMLGAGQRVTSNRKVH
jgi:hypothetical protein